MRERLNWLDSMRGLAFLMVIYYHLSTRSAGGIVPYFTPVFLTAFFFVSGYLTKSGMPFGKVLEQRTRTLFVPLLIFGLGGGIIILAKMNLGAVMDGIVEVFKGVFYQYGKHQTLWFIASLYVYSLMFYWVDNFCRTPIRLAIGCVLLIIMGQLLQYVLGCPRLPYKLESSLWAMAIMGIGKLYKLYEREVDAKIMKWQFAAVSLVLYIVLIYSFEANVLYDGHPNWFLAISIPMTGLHWMLYLSKYVIVDMKSLLFIGSNSLVYFAIHRQVLNAVEATTRKIMASLSIEPSLWSNLLEMAVIAIIIVIPVWIINKYIPQVTGKGWKLWNS